VNTATQFNIGGGLSLTRSRLDLSNPSPTPHGYSLEVLGSPPYLVLRSDSGTVIMTIASDGKVGIGDNNPLEATLEIGGTIAVSNLGGVNGDHLCRDGNLIRACSAVPASNLNSSRGANIERLEEQVRLQQAAIEKQRKELEHLRRLVCGISGACEVKSQAPFRVQRREK
jgi:hypothetical protein